MISCSPYFGCVTFERSYVFLKSLWFAGAPTFTQYFTNQLYTPEQGLFGGCVYMLITAGAKPARRYYATLQPTPLPLFPLFLPPFLSLHLSPRPT